MATSTELISLYGELRATLLARHFAIGRYFRTNYLSLRNNLGYLRNVGSTSSPEDSDDLTLGMDTNIVKPSIYGSPDDLFSKDPDTQIKERWRVGDHDRENPLMYSSYLLICLAVEQHLGRPGLNSLIKEALHSIGSLYKFKQEHFRGYPIRWDPVTSDHWVTSEEKLPNSKNWAKPRYCRDFLLSPDRTSYLYCTPFQDPRYTPFIRNEDFRKLSQEEKKAYWNARTLSLTVYRAWEPSMDELTGLIAGYDIVFRLVDDPEIKALVIGQVTDLGDYLAEHGYLLVRPGGGFTARGASGSLPAFVFPFGQVFERITGNRFEPRVGFEGACIKAGGVWGSLQGPYNNASLLAIPVLIAVLLVLPSLLVGFSGTAIALVGLLGDFGVALGLAALSTIGSALVILGAVLSTPLTLILARAYAIWSHKDCFDVQAWPGDGSEDFKENTTAQDEFVAAYGLLQLPAKIRFRFWFGLQKDRSKGWSALFPPFIGLTGVDDPEGTVRKMYLDFLPGVRMRSDYIKNPKDERFRSDIYTVNPFASAVAVILGAGAEEEKKLVELLDKWYGELAGQDKRDFWLQDDEGILHEDFRPALPFMAALALAWLHAKRQTDMGTPILSEIGFPVPPTVKDVFPAPRVPAIVMGAVANGEMSLPADTWNSPSIDPDETHGEESEGKLFDETNAPPPKKDEPPPPDVTPPKPKVPIETRKEIIVTEADSDVDTGIDIESEDELVIEASGEIWAGVWFTNPNGPDGWSNIDNDLKFWLHGPPNGYPYALIGKIGLGSGYFFIGTRFPKIGECPNDRYLYIGPGTQRLWLRINDDSPNNGSKREVGKAFTCLISVWR